MGKFMIVRIKNVFPRGACAHVQNIAANGAGAFRIVHPAGHDLPERRIVADEVVGIIIADKVRDDLAACLVGVECVPHERAGHLKECRLAPGLRHHGKDGSLGGIETEALRNAVETGQEA